MTIIRQPRHAGPLDSRSMTAYAATHGTGTGDSNGYVLRAALDDLETFARMADRAAREARDVAERIKARDHGTPWDGGQSATSLARGAIGNDVANLVQYGFSAMKAISDLDAYYARAETPDDVFAGPPEVIEEEHSLTPSQRAALATIYHWDVTMSRPSGRGGSFTVAVKADQPVATPSVRTVDSLISAGLVEWKPAMGNWTPQPVDLTPAGIDAMKSGTYTVKRPAE